MINNIIFDIGGVIIYTPKIDCGIKDNLFNLESGTIRKIVDDCFKRKSIDKNFDDKIYFAENYANFLSWEEYQKILAEFYSSEKPNYELIDWARNQKSKYRIFALTNNTTALKNLLKEKFKIENLFDIVFNSAEIGLAKPDPKLFQYVLDQIDTSPEKCLFIDDNIKNTNMAETLGFKTICFTDNNSFWKDVLKLKLKL
jgi:epoxide hydrolase-like predicted phosphatase